jgi:hypothetical protein
MPPGTRGWSLGISVDLVKRAEHSAVKQDYGHGKGGNRVEHRCEWGVLI